MFVRSYARANEQVNFAQPTRLEGTLITLRDEIKHTVKISCFNQWYEREREVHKAS